MLHALWLPEITIRQGQPMQNQKSHWRRSTPNVTHNLACSKLTAHLSRKESVRVHSIRKRDFAPRGGPLTAGRSFLARRCYDSASMARAFAIITLLSLIVPGTGASQQTTAVAPVKHVTPEWVTRSNQDAHLLLEINARFNPEASVSLGMPELDDQIIDLKPRFRERRQEATGQAITELEKRLEEGKDSAVRQDLEILIKSARAEIRGAEIRRKYLIQFYNPSEFAYWGISALLDDQVPQERRAKALLRLRKYAGRVVEQGRELAVKVRDSNQ